MIYGSGRRGSQRHKHAIQRGMQFRDVEVHRAMNEPSKVDLQTMLTEAVRNTAAQQTREPRDGKA
jgi:hypothetical protein